ARRNSLRDRQETNLYTAARRSPQMTFRMIRFACFAWLALSSFAVAADAPPSVPLEEGEQLTYRVAWGIFGRAGEIKIEAATETNDGVPNMVLTTTTQTRGVLKRLFPFEARSESIFELPSGRLMLLTEASESGKKKTRSEEHTSELQSRENLVCRRLLEKHE